MQHVVSLLSNILLKSISPTLFKRASHHLLMPCRFFATFLFSVLFLNPAYTIEFHMGHSSFVRSNVTYFGKDENASQLTQVGVSVKRSIEQTEGWLPSDSVSRLGARDSVLGGDGAPRMSLRNFYPQGSIEQTDRVVNFDFSAFHSFSEEMPYLNLRELYYQRYNKRSDGIETFTFGAYDRTWSSADEHWNLGLWQRRFGWDKLNAEQNGLIGFFAEVDRGSELRIAGLLSPLFVPDINPSFREEEGRLVSRNPWFRPPPPSVVLMGEETRVVSVVDAPSVQEVLVQPGLALRLESDALAPGTLGMSYAYKPMNQFVLGYGYKLQLQEGDSVALLDVTPHVSYHHLVTLDHQISLQEQHHLSGSLTYEQPRRLPNDPEKVFQNLDEAYYLSLTYGVDLHGLGGRHFHAYTGFLKTWGSIASDVGERAQSISQFEYRPRFFEAYRVGLSSPVWSRIRTLRNRVELTYDRLQNGMIFSSYAEWAFQNNWVASLGVDLMGIFDSKDSEYDPGFLRTYRSNDNISVGLSYVY